VRPWCCAEKTMKKLCQRKLKLMSTMECNHVPGQRSRPRWDLNLWEWSCHMPQKRWRMRILNTGGIIIARGRSKVLLYTNKTCPNASLTANSTEKSLRKKLTVALLLKRFLAFCGTQRSIIVLILRLCLGWHPVLWMFPVLARVEEWAFPDYIYIYIHSNEIHNVAALSINKQSVLLHCVSRWNVYILQKMIHGPSNVKFISWRFGKQSSCGLWVWGLSGGPCLDFFFTFRFHKYLQSPLSTSFTCPKSFLHPFSWSTKFEEYHFIVYFYYHV
jgi:hypothetical protein